MLDLFTSLIKRHKKPPHKPEDIGQMRRKELHSKIVAELNALEKETAKKFVPEHSRRFYALVKTACTLALELKYEATFQEIQQEIKKHRYPLEAQEKIIEFLNDLAIMEYSYLQFKEIMMEKLQNRETQLQRYIYDLENQGDKIRADTKKKIAQIVAETVPHSDKEMLAGMLRRFREILAQLFR